MIGTYLVNRQAGSAAGVTPALLQDLLHEINEARALLRADELLFSEPATEALIKPAKLAGRLEVLPAHKSAARMAKTAPAFSPDRS
ncbi:MAG: hypothetical protein JOY71_05785 [Acetobacteraceae bacterium]|nr:hypothetical protein [Acetobacteraceae bacterium]